MPPRQVNPGFSVVACSVLRSWMTMIGLIDIGLGNQRSVANALEAVEAVYRPCLQPEDLASCSAFVLPGVGSFADASQRLTRQGWLMALNQEVQDKQKPYLGICLGMQLLATTGFENGTSPGLNWIPGEVQPLAPRDPELTIPHMGWNDVLFHEMETGLSKGLGTSACFYFMHSFQFCTETAKHVKGITEYGSQVTACVENHHIWGAQFHPEKSQGAGLSVIRNFNHLVSARHEC
jgi:imidazole glycerol-phosphate synthase subunit HisH